MLTAAQIVTAMDLLLLAKSVPAKLADRFRLEISMGAGFHPVFILFCAFGASIAEKQSAMTQCITRGAVSWDLFHCVL